MKIPPMTMVKYTDKPGRIVKLSRQDRQEIERIAEKQHQEQRMRDVTLILENLFTREEATVKLILECLYEVGSANIINKSPLCLNLFFALGVIVGLKVIALN